MRPTAISLVVLGGFLVFAFGKIDAQVSTPAPSSNATVMNATANADWTPVIQDFDGVPMVQVPPGCFMMGMTDAEIEALIQQFGEYDLLRALGPQHPQCFDQPFWIDLTEATQADFERFGGIQADPPDFPGDNRPVEMITWFEARDFCALRGGRLPTEAEWEYAARGPDSLAYPWGDEWNSDNAVSVENSNSETAEVGSRPAGASWVGALDMSGNVFEWTSTAYAASANGDDYIFISSGEQRYSYPYVSGDGREVDNSDSPVLRVQRGGSYSRLNDPVLYFRAAFRNYVGFSGYRSGEVGFRCAR